MQIPAQLIIKSDNRHTQTNFAEQSELSNKVRSS
jgi:hypothetical protein